MQPNFIEGSTPAAQHLALIGSAQSLLVTHGALARFMPLSERRSLLENLHGEEGAGIAGVVVAIAKVIDDMPVTYQQDGKGDDAVAYLHYFRGGIDAYITEKDVDGGVQQAYGMITLTGDISDAEIGYISIVELVRNGVELDLHWQPQTLRAIKARQ